MASGLSRAIDGRLERLIVAWAHRRWPVLRLVPARLIRLVVAPAALRLRRLACWGVLAAVVPIGVVVVLLIL
jgi:hypothetical protein